MISSTASAQLRQFVLNGFSYYGGTHVELPMAELPSRLRLAAALVPGNDLGTNHKGQAVIALPTAWVFDKSAA